VSELRFSAVIPGCEKISARQQHAVIPGRDEIANPESNNTLRAFLFLTESVFVMRGRDPRIHLLRERMDCRIKSGNDDGMIQSKRIVL
jgi:hypothetical protein